MTVAQFSPAIRRSRSLRRADGGHDGRGVVVGRESSSPIALIPARAARPRRSAARTPPRAPRRGSGRARRRGSGSVETAGVNAASSLSCAALLRPSRSRSCATASRVPARLRNRDHRQPGWAISAFCEPETTTSIPHASVSSGTAPSDEIASTTSVASPTASLIARTSATTPVEVSDCWQKTRSTPASRTAAPTSAGSGLAPLVANRLHVDPVLLADRDPPLAERPVADDRHAVARRAEIRRRPTPSPRVPDAVKSKTSGLGAEDVLAAARARSRRSRGSQVHGDGRSAPRPRQAPQAARASAPA